MAKRLITASSKHSSYRTADEQKRKNPGAVRIAKKRAVQRGISVNVLPSLLLLEQHLLEEGTMVEKKKVAVSDSKNGTENYEERQIVIDIPPTVLSAFRGMFSPLQTYRFRLTRTASIISSGGGTLVLATGIYPSQFSQYSALSMLFSESRLIRTCIEYMPCASNAVTGASAYATLPGVFASAFDPAQYGGSTFVYADMQQRPGCVNFHSQVTARKVTNVCTMNRSQRLWSNIGQSSGTDPYGGNAGAWLVGAANNISPSTTYFYYVITADYEFKGLY
jgi:hypothetical protein